MDSTHLRCFQLGVSHIQRLREGVKGGARRLWCWEEAALPDGVLSDRDPAFAQGYGGQADRATENVLAISSDCLNHLLE